MAEAAPPLRTLKIDAANPLRIKHIPLPPRLSVHPFPLLDVDVNHLTISTLRLTASHHLLIRSTRLVQISEMVIATFFLAHLVFLSALLSIVSSVPWRPLAGYQDHSIPYCNSPVHTYNRTYFTNPTAVTTGFCPANFTHVRNSAGTTNFTRTVTTTHGTHHRSPFPFTVAPPMTLTIGLTASSTSSSLTSPAVARLNIHNVNVVELWTYAPGTCDLDNMPLAATVCIFAEYTDVRSITLSILARGNTYLLINVSRLRSCLATTGTYS
jgi:hypothetical protein